DQSRISGAAQRSRHHVAPMASAVHLGVGSETKSISVNEMAFSSNHKRENTAMISFWRKRMQSNQRGFTLIELMIVVAIIGILTPIAFPLYANIQSRAGVAKAQADLRTLASAVVVYSSHTGVLPAALGNLTAAVVVNNVSAGPFVSSPLPVPPTGGNPAWPANYAYTNNGDGTFTIVAAGDGVNLTVPEPGSDPKPPRGQEARLRPVPSLTPCKPTLKLTMNPEPQPAPTDAVSVTERARESRATTARWLPRWSSIARRDEAPRAAAILTGR